MCFQSASGTKICDSSALATLQKTGQVASAAGSRNRHNPPMFLRLDFEPEKTTPFQNLPVKSARTATNRRFT
ncbi:hypothetical protein FD01_GL001449 [Lacticaseibacillus manihotivorans DSM 13343 = JCM 12514]|uniref:Uncharacterized protein n=1 Tax=Lacticaseibacillus manihotivorans DSM 13343 = JCM 12514 TaxID=1423769 RepID=A0A0R1QS24_9LACO|nr:hypothetical protein FD01_GL001449 [Lacticaseibacillus manihotivorans DSM 13343 = JCM 12514]